MKKVWEKTYLYHADVLHKLPVIAQIVIVILFNIFYFLCVSIKIYSDSISTRNASFYSFIIFNIRCSVPRPYIPFKYPTRRFVPLDRTLISQGLHPYLKTALEFLPRVSLKKKRNKSNGFHRDSILIFIDPTVATVALGTLDRFPQNFSKF